MDTILSLCLGIGLSAACGFRVFVPLLGMSLAAQAGLYTPAAPFDWVGTPAALLALAVATVLEIAAYYVPWLDNLLDTIASPAAVGAGVLATAASLDGVPPMLGWALAVIAGGGAAGAVQAATGVTRAASSATTGGLANPVVATGELAGAVGLSALAIFVPALAAVAVLGLGFFALRILLRRFGRKAIEPSLNRPG